MFRSFIYLDEDKLYTYKRQIDGKNDPKLKGISKKKTAGFAAAIKGVGLNGSTETSIDRTRLATQLVWLILPLSKMAS